MFEISRLKNHLFVITLGITVALLLVGFLMGKADDKKFAENEYLFDMAINKIWENPNESYETLRKLYLETPDNPLVVWQYGLAHSATNDFDKAIDYFIHAQNLKPALSRNPNFLIQFGWTLKQNSDLDNAKIYLERSLSYRLGEEQKKYVTDLLQDINKLKTKEG